MRVTEVVASATPLHGADDFDPLLARIGDARVVMLGEASHGTHDFHHWRAELTRRLVAERDFGFVAVAGDWSDCRLVDDSVRLHPQGRDDPHDALREFTRWPTWMWANHETAAFCRWLRVHNAELPAARQVGFHGLDVFGMSDSLRAVFAHLLRHDPDSALIALDAYLCFEPHDRRNPVLPLVPSACEDEMVEVLSRLRRRAVDRTREEFSAWHDAETVAAPDRYYRAVLRGGPGSWNVRDTHLADTLDRLLDHYGADARAVVWAHNTHIGDARATAMAADGMISLGQLARERHGDRVVLVGFGCYQGTVVAAPHWGAQSQKMTMPPARPGSIEAALRDEVPERSLFVFPPVAAPRLFTDELAQRAVGVVYDPAREPRGSYVPTRLAERYDAFCWFVDTVSLHPLPTIAVDAEDLEPSPAGV